MVSEEKFNMPRSACQDWERVKVKGLLLVKLALKVKLIYSLHVNSGKYTNVVTFLHIFTILEG